MGRMIDSIFVSACVFAGFFLTLSFSGKSAPLCALISLLGAGCAYVLISYILTKTPQISFHRRRTQAARRVRGMIYETAKEAHEAVFCLLKRRYPVDEERFDGASLSFTHAQYDKARLHVIQKLRVTPDDVLKAWREQGAGRNIRALIVAVPGRSESDIRVLASRLTSPDVIILDRHQLVAMTRRTDKIIAPAKEVRLPHLLPALKGYVTRRRAMRYFFYALLMAGYYVLTGKPFYLVSGLLLGYMASFCMVRPGEPGKLIEGVSPARPDECGNPRAPRDK